MRTRLAGVVLAALLATTMAGCPSGSADEDCEAVGTTPVVAQHLTKPGPPGGGGKGR